MSNQNLREEKSYEKDDLFGGHGVTFGFDGIVELRASSSEKNTHHKEHPIQSTREMGGMDDL